MCRLAPFLHQTALLSVILSTILVRQECSCLSLRTYATGISHTWIQSSSEHQKTAPSPCAYCIGRPRYPPGSLFGLPPSLNSRTSRVLHSSSFRASIRFHSALPHSIAPFRNPHGYISFSQHTCSRLFFHFIHFFVCIY